MKVFISWSGEHSNKIAETLKKWIKHVIQSVEPFVSSEDVQKGSRWSADIAKELQDTDFGVLCVTKDNFNAPWLLFEAGALSKTMDKALVVPLLFGLKPSDLSDSPLLQFQATPFSKDEMKKLINTMNEKSERKLDDLDEAFEKWYPDLQKALEKISSSVVEKNENIESETIIKSSEVLLEEILSLSRDNQKLLRNPESFHSDELKLFSEKLERLCSIIERNEEYSRRRHKFHPMIVEELFHFSRKELSSENSFLSFLVVLSYFREEFPWIYDLGKDLISALKTNKSQRQKDEAIRNFKKAIEFSVHLPVRFDKRYGKIEDMMMLRDLPILLMDFVDRTFLEDTQNN